MPNKNKRPPARRPAQTKVIGPGEIVFAGKGSLTHHRRMRAIHFIGEEGHQRRWQGDPVEVALQNLYSGRVPSRNELSNTDLTFTVQAYMRDHKMADPLPSRDTILRAAGRRLREKRRKR